MDMYYDYARAVLDNENFDKFTKYVDQVFSLKTFGTVYFYGTGGNGKSTLVRKMINSYPTIFGGPDAKNVHVKIYEDETYPQKCPGEGAGSVIIVTNTLPDGVHPDRIVSFNKKL